MNAARRILARAPSSPRRIKAFALPDREPPEAIRLWSVGDNPTDFGVHKWTERSAELVAARYEQRGNPLLIDVEHNASTLEDGEPAATAGYARLELRNGEPWLSFEWSAYGAEQIRTGQRRFLSPEYDVDPVTSEITALYRVSLVADPATHRARILASAQENTNMDPKLAAIMAILGSVTDPAAAIESIKSLVENLDGGTTEEAPAVETPAEGTPAFTSAEGDGDDEDKEKKVVVAAAPATPPETTKAAAPVIPPAVPPPAVVTPTSSVEPEHVRASRENALRSETALRDVLLTTHGHRLEPSIRQWASTQSLAVVQGLVKAAPEKALPPPARVHASRGASHGAGTVQGAAAERGLQGRDLEEVRMRLGTHKASANPMPHRNERGDLVLPCTPPREAVRVMAAAAAGKGDQR